MAADSDILREYLIALGFRVDETGGKKVTNTLQVWDKRATALTRGLGAVAVAAQAMVTSFAYNMEKLYYASKRTDSTVSSIQALEYGASRIGLKGGQIQASLEAMARAMRSNPGLQGLLQSLGVKVEGRDKADVMMDLVKALQKMPFYVAEKYANLFGIDPDTLFMLQQGMDEMKKAADERKQIAADMNYDAEAAAKTSVEYNNQWREIVMRAGMFRDILAMEMLPKMLEFAGVIKEVLGDWTKIIRMDSDDFWQRFNEGIGLPGHGKRPEGGVELVGDAKRDAGIAPMGQTNPGWFRKKYENFMEWGGAKGYQKPVKSAAEADAETFDDGSWNKHPEMSEAERVRRTRERLKLPAVDAAGKPVPASRPSYVPNDHGGYTYQPPEAANDPGAAQGPSGAFGKQGQSDAGPDPRTAAMFSILEKRYALTPGTLDRVWKKESSRGDNLTGPTTSSGSAKGHFQITDATAKDLGLDLDGGRKDRDDLNKSAAAAARYLGSLKQKYGTDQEMAAAYNWGPGNLDKYGLGRAPAETRDYVKSVAPTPTTQQNITQTNNVTVNGSSNPEQAARSVRDQIDESNADVIRNMKAKVM